MAEVTQYGFDLRELTIALVRHQNLHEGLWMLAFEFSFGAGLTGPSPPEAMPTAFIQVSRALLTHPPEGAADSSLIVNAAEMNPLPAPEASKSSPSRRGRRRVIHK
jgi:hypothetical protein